MDGSLGFLRRKMLFCLCLLRVGFYEAIRLKDWLANRS
jgi:hypothetical protein